jgi:hypothetical protein
MHPRPCCCLADLHLSPSRCSCFQLLVPPPPLLSLSVPISLPLPTNPSYLPPSSVSHHQLFLVSNTTVFALTVKVTATGVASVSRNFANDVTGSSAGTRAAALVVGSSSKRATLKENQEYGLRAHQLPCRLHVFLHTYIPFHTSH